VSAVHSPGPWRNCGANRGGCKCGLIWSKPADHVVAEVVMEDDDHKKSDELFQGDARLIAAAPDMLDLLEMLAEHGPAGCDALEHIPELLARIKGQQPSDPASKGEP
jgi:hypothetical protein